VHVFKPPQKRVTLWPSSESSDIWFIPQSLVFGIQKEQVLISWDTRTWIGRETKWIENQHPGLANSWVGRWCVGLPRKKIVSPYLRRRQSMSPPEVVVLNYFG
jgi:hypothetical protein